MPRFKKVTGLTNLTSRSVTAAQHCVGPQFPLHLLPEGPPQATTSAAWCLALLCVKLPVRECEVSHLSSPINSLRLPCCKWSLPSEFRDVRTKQFVIFYEKGFEKSDFVQFLQQRLKFDNFRYISKSNVMFICFCLFVFWQNFLCISYLCLWFRL